MDYTKKEVMEYVAEEDVKFIRLAFCDVFGNQKNISIMPGELERAFMHGVAFDASAIRGFGDEAHSDLLLHPDPDTLMWLPWRPEHGRVVRMYSDITYPDGHPFERDTRRLLRLAVEEARKAGYTFFIGAEQEFYLFELDEKNEPTKKPYDRAGYMDIAPDDKCENIRREICLTLEQMGITPESSHHEQGPGQCEIDFRYSDALTAADNALTFRNVVKTVARRNGLYADFSPKPIENEPGSGFHINISVRAADGGVEAPLTSVIAGMLDKIDQMTVFLDPTRDSYRRLGNNKAPGYITWSYENRSQLIRVPAAADEYVRAELRSPDPATNPYIAFALVIYASLYGLENRLELPPPTDMNNYTVDPEDLAGLKRLPDSLAAAAKLARSGDLVGKYLPKEIIDAYCNR